MLRVGCKPERLTVRSLVLERGGLNASRSEPLTKGKHVTVLTLKQGQNTWSITGPFCSRLGGRPTAAHSSRGELRRCLTWVSFPSHGTTYHPIFGPRVAQCIVSCCTLDQTHFEGGADLPSIGPSPPRKLMRGPLPRTGHGMVLPRVYIGSKRCLLSLYFLAF